MEKIDNKHRSIDNGVIGTSVEWVTGREMHCLLRQSDIKVALNIYIYPHWCMYAGILRG